MSSTKRYFLTRNTDFSPDGPLRLGTILVDPEDPHSILERTIVDNDKFPIRSVPDDDGPFASTGPIKLPGLDLKWEKMETVRFSPSTEYVGKYLTSSTAVRNHLQSSNSSMTKKQRSVYIVTGLKIAKGANISNRDTSTKSVSIGVEVDPCGWGALELGVNILSGSQVEKSVIWGGKRDFVFAYQLLKADIKLTTPSIVRLNLRIGERDRKGLEPTEDVEVADEERVSETEMVTEVVDSSVKEVDAPDTTKPARILCLDGGGVRGISSLYMLQEIMLKVAQSESGTTGNVEPAKPCDYFDLICGTSAGGLIALMLGRLEYTVDQAIERYEKLSKAIFTSKSSSAKAKYDHTVLEEKIKEVVSESDVTNDADERLANLAAGKCKTFVVATHHLDGSKPYLMRSYKPKERTIEPSPFPATIWEAARATSAAPTFFEPIDIDLSSCTGLGCGIDRRPGRARFGDGGTTANNPTWKAWRECSQIWPQRPLGCIISLGTGVEEPARITKLPGWGMRLLRKIAPGIAFTIEVAKYLAEVATSCERTHDDVMATMKKEQRDHLYFRLNVPGLGIFQLDGLADLDKMRDRTSNYLGERNVKGSVERIGAMLRHPECEYKSMGSAQYGPTRGDVQAPGFQANPMMSALLKEYSEIKLNPPSSSSNAGTQDRETAASPIQWTWPLYKNKLLAIHSVMFHHHNCKDRHGASDTTGIDHKSAIAFVELRSRFSFLSTRFVKKWGLDMEDVPPAFPHMLEIGDIPVTAKGWASLAFQCEGLGMPRQRVPLYVLESDEFEILLGQNALVRCELEGREAAARKEAAADRFMFATGAFL